MISLGGAVVIFQLQDYHKQIIVMKVPKLTEPIASSTLELPWPAIKLWLVYQLFRPCTNAYSTIGRPNAQFGLHNLFDSTEAFAEQDGVDIKYSADF